MSAPIYLDHMATTPCDPRVVEAMLPYLTQHFGNAGSRSHSYGWVAEEAVKQAREQVAAALGAQPREIVFTSGATEANNLVIKGIAEAGGRHFITQATEHKAVLEPMAVLARHGFDVTVLPVDAHGWVRPEQVAEALRPDTALVSIMHANNEIGTVQPLAEIGAVCRAHGVLFHTDAAQTVGKLPVTVDALQVDLLSLSAHKFYGPKGVGALYIRRRRPRIALSTQIHGGQQERKRRAGTVPVHQVVALGKAIELACAAQADEAHRQAVLQKRLLEGVCQALPTTVLNGHPEHRLPNNLHLSFPGIEAEALMLSLRELALSSGSACTSETLGPSHVLRAIGLSDALSHASLRFGLGQGTTAAQIEQTIALLSTRLPDLRKRGA